MISRKPLRAIRSFVRREGRLTDAQQCALNEYWSNYGVDFQENAFDQNSLFKRRAPLIIDIGAGTGDSTLYQAIQFPKNNYLAIEVHRPGVGHLLNEIHKAQLTNIKVINHDVIPVLEKQITNRSISQFFIFFPDPWPKKRHHKRRLINAYLINLLKQKLTRHGRIHIATDWADYADHISEVFKQDNDLVNLAGQNNFSPRPNWRIETRYEKRGQRLSHEIYDFCFTLR